MKKLTFTLAVALSALFWNAAGLHAQAYQPPANYSMNTDADYARYEPEILKCADYLESTPIGQDIDNRKAAATFLVKWLTGTPSVTIDIMPYSGDMTENNPDLLVAYMGGWARYAIQHKKDYDRMQAHMAAVKSVLKLYKLGNVKKNAVVEKLLPMSDKQLLAWITQQVKSSSNKAD